MSENHKSAALHTHAKRGWMWCGIDQFAERGLTMIVSLILARLLGPSAFGLIASVSIFFGVVAQLIDGGIGQRVLQKDEVTEDDCCALFWCTGLVALLCSSLLIFFSGMIARFYGNPQIQLIVIAMAVNIFLASASRTQDHLLIRELQFRVVSISKIISVSAGCITGLIMAFSGCGIWSLIGQYLVATLVRVGYILIVMPWRPSKWPSWSAVKGLYEYGLPVFFSSTVKTLADSVINVLVAKRSSFEALGFLDRGRVVPQNIGNSLAGIFSRVNFPVLAKLQYDEIALRETYIKFLRIGSAIYFMLMTGLAVCAQDVILVLLGEKWIPSVWFLRAGCVAFSVFVIFTANSELLRAKGRTGIFFRYNMISAGLQIAGILTGMFWGVRGMVLGDILARGLICIPLVMAVGKISLITTRNQLSALLRPLAGSAVIAAGLMAVRLAGLSLWPRFVLSGMAGAGIIFLYWRTSGFKIKDIPVASLK